MIRSSFQVLARPFVLQSRSFSSFAPSALPYLPNRPVSPSALRVIRSATDDPFFNLAFEECLVADLHNSSLSASAPSFAPTLFIWQNRPAVIMGRYQNPFAELFLSRLEENDVSVVRRKTGGGTVYQDHGNSIFSFIAPDPSVGVDGSAVKTENNQVLLNTLKQFGVIAETSGRNDIIVRQNSDIKKISGHAFKKDKGILLHHGTMLLHLDFSRLQDYLNPNKLKLLSKGVASVSARVSNLRDLTPELKEITHNVWGKKLEEEFIEFHRAKLHQSGETLSDVVFETADLSALSSSDKLKNAYDTLKSWTWRYGSTPSFSHFLETKFPFALFSIHLQVDKGIITGVKVFSDALDTRLVEVVEATLKGEKVTGESQAVPVRYEREAIGQAFDQAEKDVAQLYDPGMAEQIKQVKEWIASQIS